MKIVLVNPPDDLEVFLGKGKNFVPIFEPLGLLYISAVCKQKGYAVSIVDAFAQRLSPQGIKDLILIAQPDVVAFTVLISNGNIVYELGKWIKKTCPNTTVILGNIHASVYAEAYLRNRCCDIVVHGEAEYTFLGILEVLEGKQKDFSGIQSISYLHGENFITTSGPRVIENLETLPLPDRDGVKQELYNIPAISNIPYCGKNNSIGKHMFTSRGCLFSCAFCVVPIERGQRCNSIVNVADEIEVMIKKYSAKYIFIMDSLFISNKKRVIDICKEIKKRGLNFKWGCEGHVNFVDQELIEEMESAGCNDISFGIESGVQRLLDNTQKGTQLARIEKAINTVKKTTKIKATGLFILGLPGETYKDSLRTIEFSKRLPLDMAQFSILVPYPGSQLFYELKKKGEINTGIREDGSLDTSVWPRYSAYISYTSYAPIWVTPGLSYKSLKKLQKKAFRDFYFRPKQFYAQLKRVNTSNLLMAMETFIKAFF